MTPSTASHLQKRIVLTFSLAAFLFQLSMWVVVVYLPIYLEKSIGLARTEIGLLVSIHAITLIVLVAPLGHFSDRASPKRIVQAGLVLVAVYCVLLSRARVLPLLILAQVLGGSGNSLVIIALGSLYYKHLTISRKGRKVSLYIFATFLGFALGPLLSGFLLGQCGLSYPSLFLIVAGVAGGLLLFSNVLKDSEPFKIRLFEYKEDILRKEVFLLIAMLVAMGIHYGNESTSFSLYMRNVVQLDDFHIGSIFAVIGFWIAILSVVAGALYDWSKKLLLFVALGLVVSGSFHIWTAFTKSYGSVLLARLLHTTGDAVVIFSMNAIIASIFPAHRMGGNFGFASFFRMQGAFIGALGSGLLDTHCSYRASFISAGCCTILIGFVLAANWRTMLRLSRQLAK